jgi:lipopolysaccharide biosynthesis regulator YciM
LRKTHPSLAHRVIGNLVETYQSLGDDTGLSQFLKEERSVPREKLAFLLWSLASKDVFGESIATIMVCDRVVESDFSASVSAYLLQLHNQKGLSSAHEHSLLSSLLNREKNRQIEYTCVGCGFDTKAMYWYCPNCGQWESFH